MSYLAKIERVRCPGQLHRDALRDAGAHDVPRSRAPQVMHETTWRTLCSARDLPGFAEVPDRHAIAMENPWAYPSMLPLPVRSHGILTHQDLP
jgi:hypothetical protein